MVVKSLRYNDDSRQIMKISAIAAFLGCVNLTHLIFSKIALYPFNLKMRSRSPLVKFSRSNKEREKLSNFLFKCKAFIVTIVRKKHNKQTAQT